MYWDDIINLSWLDLTKLFPPPPSTRASLMYSDKSLNLSI